jgi:hypothetical protein
MTELLEGFSATLPSRLQRPSSTPQRWIRRVRQTLSRRAERWRAAATEFGDRVYNGRFSTRVGTTG